VLKKNILFLSFILFLNLHSQDLDYITESHQNQGSFEVVSDFQSSFVDDRTVEFWLPPNFDPTNKYDLLIMHDGQNLFDANKTWNKQEWKLDEWASKLILENELSSFIIIGIHNSGKNRWNDYFPEKAYDFVKDVKYLIDNKPALYADLYLKYIIRGRKTAK